MSDPIIERLRSPDVNARVTMLHALGRIPDVRPEVIAELERLVDDRRCTRLYVPYRYGELRVLAAEVLAVARAKLGDLRPVVLIGVPRLLTSDQMEPFRERAGIPGIGGPGPLECYQLLRDGGHLPVLDHRFEPATYLEAGS